MLYFCVMCKTYINLNWLLFDLVCETENLNMLLSGLDGMRLLLVKCLVAILKTCELL